MSQRTLVLLKPDAVKRGLAGEIISRIERKAGWRLAAVELRTFDRATLEQHYAEHVGRPFYEPLLEFMTSGPSIALIVEGENVIPGIRALAGATDPLAGRRRHHPRRLRDDHPREPDPRLGLRGVRRARDQDLLPRPAPDRGPTPRRRPPAGGRGAARPPAGPTGQNSPFHRQIRNWEARHGVPILREAIRPGQWAACRSLPTARPAWLRWTQLMGPVRLLS